MIILKWTRAEANADGRQTDRQTNKWMPISHLLNMLGKIFSRQYFVIFFFNFNPKIGFEIPCKFVGVGINKKNIINSSSAEFTNSILSVSRF